MNPHTTTASASRDGSAAPGSTTPPWYAIGIGLATCEIAWTQSASVGRARRPGALDITWPSPRGNITMSPADTRTGGSPSVAAHPAPFTIMWYASTWSAPGSTAPAISRDGGASATQSSRQLT